MTPPRPPGATRANLVLANLVLACLAPLLLPLASSPAAHAASGEAQPSCRSAAVGDVPAARLDALARGFNLVGWLDRGDRRRPSPAWLVRLRSEGFTHVRLPVDGALLMPDLAPRTTIDDTLAELDAALDTLLNIGFVVSLDMHPAAAFNQRHTADPAWGLAALEAAWRTLARRYAAISPDLLFIELLNEPAVPLDIWQSQSASLARTLRTLLPQHTLILASADFQQAYRLLQTAPIADRNVVYAVHFYEPMSFTHQGADWNPADPVAALSAIPFPLTREAPSVRAHLAGLKQRGLMAAADLLARDSARDWTKARIDDTMRGLADWSRRHTRPVLINEFGVLKWKAPAADRLRWLEAVRTGAERHCLGWTHWEFDEAFGFLTRTNTGVTLDETVLRALLPNTAAPPR